MISEPAKIIEIERDRNKDDFSAKPVAGPMAPVRVTARAFNMELERLKELEKDLRSEVCSAKPDAEPSEVVRLLARPLISEPA